MEICIRTFSELSNHELYAILKSRQAVFVIEQQCFYEDIDGIDEKSLHVFCKEDDEIIAYLRLFEKDEDSVQMGRVLTMVRGKGYGEMILKEGIKAARDHYEVKRIYAEVQSYARAFYERAGFRVCGKEFVEDGIPHIPMELVF